MKKAVICFTRVPQPGKTKTRLMSFLTGEECAALHSAFLKDISAVLAPYDADVFVAYTPEGDHRELRRIFPYAKDFSAQKGGELGEKMHNCLSNVLEMGYQSCVLVGADLPLLSKAHFDSAFSALEKADVTLGPTEDGGYYLVGLKKPCAAIFTNQQYSCDSVFLSAVKAAENEGCTVEQALACRDVDTAEDLYALLEKLSPDSETAKTIELFQLRNRFDDESSGKHGDCPVESLPFWDLLNKNQKKRIVLKCFKESFKRGSLFYGNSDKERGLIMLQSGTIRAYMVSSEGRELNTFHFHPGDICLLTAGQMMPELDLECLMEATEDVQALSLRTEDVAALMEENKDLQLYMYKLFTERYTSIVKLLAEVVFDKVDKRLAKYLIEEAERGRGKTVLATHDHIACEIGSAREVVSKTLKQMVKNGLISLGYNRIEILDSEALQAIAGNNSI